MRSDALPIWMVDNRGNQMPAKWVRWWGRTPGKMYKPVKRQGKWWTLGLPDRLTVHDVELVPRADVREWMHENVGPIGNGCWDFREKMWYDHDDGTVVEMRLYFPDMESLTQFSLVFSED